MKKLILYVIGSLSVIAVSLMTINVIFSDKSNYQTIENVESKTEETIQEKSLEISFDDENLKYMASVIYGSSNFLLEADNGELNQSNLDISKKEFIALSQCDSKDWILAPREELKYKDIESPSSVSAYTEKPPEPSNLAISLMSAPRIPRSPANIEIASNIAVLPAPFSPTMIMFFASRTFMRETL